MSKHHAAPKLLGWAIVNEHGEPVLLFRSLDELTRHAMQPRDRPVPLIAGDIANYNGTHGARSELE